MTDSPRAAVAAGVLPDEAQHRALLQSIVEAARAIFSAGAASIFLHDEETDELVFEAAAGEGGGELVGLRIPSGTGIAGWVLVTRQPLVLSDLENDPRFARDVAEKTGYVPSALMAVPLLHDERALGVLQVLDSREDGRSGLEEMDLLGLFASQAAIALDLLRGARRARAVIEGGGGDIDAVTALATTLEALDGERREAGVALLRALEQVLRPS
ncbi:MAG: putative sensor protein [Gaiellaceae bacterium]|jgi:GAF domain-containing protein|nr:putative sensor protein [Gaiellaceae bacterium]